MVFDSGSPYNHKQYCSNEFSCEDSSVALHFKFNRFSLEQGHDYLAITSEESAADYLYVNYSIYEDYSERNLLILSGEQETGVWVNAESIQNIPSFGSDSKLRVTFYRQGYEEHFDAANKRLYLLGFFEGFFFGIPVKMKSF